jgi:Tol biopolymer transport system component
MIVRPWFAAMAMVVAASSAAQQAPPSYNDMFGAWSPDGRRIAFTSDRSGDPEIYVANADGSGLLRLTNTPGRDAHPSWSSNGKHLLFQSPRADGNVQIYRMNADGTDQRRLAATTGFCGVPVESPNARHIAFQCSQALKDFGSAAAPWRIYVLDRGKPEPRLISTGPGNDQVPNWSRDGRRLIFFSDRSGTNQLYELNTRRGTTSQRSFEPASHGAATYSPDGRRIAVMRTDPGGKGDIFVIGPKGRIVRITDSGPEFGMAVWSRDGKRLLFQMPTPGGVRLFTAPSDGSARPEMVEFR